MAPGLARRSAGVDRRSFLARSGALLAAGAFGCARGNEGSTQRLRVMLNGGIYEELARRLVVEPFERDTGARVEVVPGSAAQILTRLRAERSAPTVDVALLDRLIIGTSAHADLFETIDPANVPSLGDLAEEALDPSGRGPAVHSHNLALGYNTTRLQVEPPASWADLWHPRFKGLIVPAALELTPGVLFLLQANALNGGTYENVDPGFDAVKRLAANIKSYYRSIGEVRPLLANENAIVAVSTNILQSEVDQGRPVGIVFPREGCLASPMVAQVIRGTRVKALAERFIEHYLRPDAQRGWATEYYVTVFNRKAQVPESISARITRGNRFFDPEQVSRHREAWLDRWTREIRG